MVQNGLHPVVCRVGCGNEADANAFGRLREEFVSRLPGGVFTRHGPLGATYFDRQVGFRSQLSHESLIDVGLVATEAMVD